MNRINEHNLSDLYDISSGISTTKAQAGHGSPFVSFGMVFNNYFLPDELPDQMDTSEAEQQTYSVKKGDILLTRTSETVDELAMSCVSLRDYPHATFSGFTKRLRPKTQGVAYHKYLGFYLRGYLFRQAVTNHSIMTLRSSFNEEIFALLKVYLPEYDQQIKIGDFLYSIEQKIQLNNAINSELEKTAKLLYDYWFAQSDFPDAEGKPYRSSGGAMEFNVQLKREIPKGWEVKTLSEVVDNITEGTKPGDHLRDMFYTPLDDIPMRRMSFFGGQSHEEANSSLILYRKNDILLGAMRVHFHRVCISAQDGITRSTTIVMRPKEPDIMPFLYQVVNSDETIAYAVRQSGKSQQPYVNWEGELEKYSFAMPPEPLALQYSDRILSMIDKVKSNERENYELTALRDFLLPLLMNGQVTVAMADSMVEQAPVATAEQPQAMSAAAKRATVFKRLVLSAYILDNICDEPTSGRVKFEKLLYLSEHCAQLPLHSEFQRAAAGPYDAVALYSIEGQLSRNKWFKGKKATGGRTVYSRLAKVDGYRKYIDTNFDIVQKGVIDKLLRLLRHADTEQCEIVATLYGAWNDFIIDGVHPSDDQIVDEVLTNWNPSKERIERNRWVGALTWMRQNGIVPVGYGVSTK